MNNIENFTQIPNYLFTSGISTYAFMMVCYIKSQRVDYELSDVQITNDTGISKNTLKKCRQELVDKEIIIYERKSKGFIYTVNPTTRDTVNPISEQVNPISEQVNPTIRDSESHHVGTNYTNNIRNNITTIIEKKVVDSKKKKEREKLGVTFKEQIKQLIEFIPMKELISLKGKDKSFYDFITDPFISEKEWSSFENQEVFLPVHFNHLGEHLIDQYNNGIFYNGSKDYLVVPRIGIWYTKGFRQSRLLEFYEREYDINPETISEQEEEKIDDIINGKQITSFKAEDLFPKEDIKELWNFAENDNKLNGVEVREKLYFKPIPSYVPLSA